MNQLFSTDTVTAPTLETERFTLRLLHHTDAENIHRLINDWSVVRMLSMLPFPYPHSLAEEWVASSITQATEGSAYHYAIIDKAETDPKNALVGCIGIRIDAKRNSGILGYWIGRKFWNKGIATECCLRVSQWALANLHISSLCASAATDNIASIKVLKKMGFRETGTSVEKFIARGADQPVCLFEARHDDLFSLPLVDAHESSFPTPFMTVNTHSPREAETKVGKSILLVSAVALIDSENHVLIARRPEGKPLAGLWEFPGGKIEALETPEAGLIRELKEELDIDILADCLAPFSFVSKDYPQFHLLMTLYLCRRWKNTPTPKEGQQLLWVAADELDRYPMPEADRPLIPLLRDLL